MKYGQLNLLNGLINDEKGQGSAELILIVGGIIVIILVVVSMYKSYLSDLGTEIGSNEMKTLNSSFSDIASRFEWFNFYFKFYFYYFTFTKIYYPIKQIV